MKKVNPFAEIGVGFGAALALSIVQTVYPSLFSGYFWPLEGMCVLIVLLGVLRANHPSNGAADSLQPNLPIARGVDYLVNDSTAVLEQNPEPEVATFGPAKGQLIAWNGKPQQDALNKIEEQLALGTLSAFGRPALTPGDNPTNFDPILRAIPQDYWNVGGLHGLFARIDGSTYAQTYLRPTAQGQPLYGDVRLDKNQLRAFWKPRGFWRRLWERGILRKERIGDHLLD